MKTRLLVAALVLGLVVPAVQAGVAAWRKLAPDGKFEVMLPVKPTHQKQRLRAPFGVVEQNRYLAVDDDRDIVYLVETWDLPPGLWDTEQSPEEVLDILVRGFIRNLKGQNVRQKQILLGDNPGREFEATILDGIGHLNGRAFLVEDRVYILAVLSPISEEDPRNADRFLRSFKVFEPVSEPLFPRP
jgi:hypothetical protein